MSFSAALRDEALVRSRRCCCICNEFVGLYTNVHHIVQEADGGSNTLDNAIVLCLRCHGEVGHYNPRHPIGNKYSVEEVRRHRDLWWAWCEHNPAVPLAKLPISVTPTVVTIAGGGWVSKTVVTVGNKSDAVYYDVWIRFSFELVAMTFEEIQLTDICVTQQLLGEVGSMKVCGDMWMFAGTDESGSAILLLLLHSLQARQSSTFSLSLRDPSIAANRPEMTAKATICVSSFSPEPEGQFLESKDKLARSFKFPEEGITIKAMAFKTAKSG